MDWPSEFYRYLEVERGYSKKTVAAYSRDFHDFQMFLNDTGNPDYLGIDHRDVRVYLAYLNDHDYSRNTISRKIASLRSFTVFIARRSYRGKILSLCSLEEENNKLLRFFMNKRCKPYLKRWRVRSLCQRNRSLLEVLWFWVYGSAECANLKL